MRKDQLGDKRRCEGSNKINLTEVGCGLDSFGSE